MHVDTNRGPGLQHMALGVKNLVGAVERAAGAGVQFLATPPTYYQLLPQRLKSLGISSLDGAIPKLAANGILVDGDRNGYLLQIFCRDQATQFGRPSAGPLLLELIERAGCQGFGEGNFRAIFEATARMQND
jgi:4-hydroxyphenylpyruvate dioxygenase